MANTDRFLWNEAVRGMMGSAGLSNVGQMADQLDERAIRILVPADAAALTNIGNSGGGTSAAIAFFDKPVKILAIKMAYGNNVASNTTNGSLYTIDSDANANGGAVSILAIMNTNGGTFVGGSVLDSATSALFTTQLQTANVNLVAGSSLRLSSIKWGTVGIQFPVLMVDVRYREVGP